VQRFGRFIFSWHLGVTIIVTVAVVAGSPPPLAGLMILWNNLVIDVLPSFALALEPAAEDTMKDPPRPAGEPVLGRSTLKRIATQAALIAAVGLTTFYVLAPAFDLDGAARQTMTFVAITAASSSPCSTPAPRPDPASSTPRATRSCGSPSPSRWRSRPQHSEFPALRDTLGLDTMPADAWAAALLIAVAPLLLTQTTRVARQRWTAQAHHGSLGVR
jgi:P-type Ca2+ transporter type 2C